MNPREQIAEVLEQHRPYGLDCKCGVAINSDAWWAWHAAAVVVEALGLTEEAAYQFRHIETGLSSIIEADSPTEAMARWIAGDTHTLEPVRRWVSGWSVVGGEQ